MGRRELRPARRQLPAHSDALFGQFRALGIFGGEFRKVETRARKVPSRLGIIGVRLKLFARLNEKLSGAPGRIDFVSPRVWRGGGCLSEETAAEKRD
jgi:hypothetical protein